MEFGCSVCEFIASDRRTIVRHINRQKSCGPGTKELIEIPMEIKCEFCNKLFMTKETLEHHAKNTCKMKDKIKDEEIKKLKEEVNFLKKNKNTIINNQNTINIYINNYEDTDLDKLTDKIYNKIISGTDELYQIIPRMIKEIHFNPKMPENHNIYISNKNRNNKYLQVYRNKHWEIERKDAEISNLINDKETNLSDWICEKGEKYPEAKEIFGEYLEQKHDEDTIKMVKEDVELVLYNNRHMIRN